VSALALALARVLEGRALSEGEMAAAMESILAGDAPAAQIAGLAIALRMRGETAEELAAAARAMRKRVVPIAIAAGTGERRALLDTCGTGGDGAGTFNVSTACAIVVASCGVRVAKHGNRAISSRAGSADVLEALGVTLDAGPERVAQHIDELGIGFFFAPAYHSALKHAAAVRRELGVRTFFNLLGPLTNPAGATHQLLGVYDPSRVRVIAEVLALLGVEAAWVVHGAGGVDEISIAGPTRIARLRDGAVEETTLEPGDFGIEPEPLDGIAGGDAARNAELVRAVLSGERGPRRKAVVINAAAALVIAGVERDLRAARERAEAAIDRGAASRLLAAWAART
jgi:anthranilate phosphoribosyltransferase